VHNDYTTGVDIALALLVLIAIVVTIDIARSFERKPLPPPRDPAITTSQKITVDLDRRS
jgi:hypothetical protein